MSDWAKRAPSEDELKILGGILARFCAGDGVAYWGFDRRRARGAPDDSAGMTIDNTITVTADELVLLDDLFEQW